MVVVQNTHFSNNFKFDLNKLNITPSRYDIELPTSIILIALPIKLLDDQLACIDIVQGINVDCRNAVGWDEGDYLASADWAEVM